MEFLIGTDIELIVPEVFTPTMFYIQLKDDWDKLDSLMENMNYSYANCPYLEQLIVPPEKLRVDQKVAVVWEDGLWYRGLVRRVMSVKLVEVDYMDYGSRTVTDKSNLYELDPQFCDLPRMSHLARLHGIVPLQKKWIRSVSTRFGELVVPKDEAEERQWLFVGKIMGVKEGRVELELVYTKSDVAVVVNFGSLLVHEGLAQYPAQEDGLVISQDIPASGISPLLPVLSTLGDCLAGEVDRPLPAHLQEEIDDLKAVALSLKQQQVTETVKEIDTAKGEKKLVNKAIGLMLRIFMRSKPLTEIDQKDDGDEDEDGDHDSGVDSRSVQSYQSKSLETCSQDNSKTSAGSMHRLTDFLA